MNGIRAGTEQKIPHPRYKSCYDMAYLCNNTYIVPLKADKQ